MSSSPGSDLAVDIVVNNHNYAQFVAAAIESACGQTHPKVNVIVVDDGSTDGSCEVISRYEARVEIILKDQGGQASALNAGFSRCSGDIVLFLDADDTVAPEAAARLAAAFAADEQLVKVQFRTEVIDGEGRESGVVKPLPHLPMPNGDMRRAELARPFDIVWMATSANAYRRMALARIMPIPEQAFPRTGADWYLVHMAALLGPVRSLPEVSGCYRVHGANSYEPAKPILDLNHVRQAIGYTSATRPELLRLADELGLPRPRRILSTADLGYRMISICGDPDRHPVPGERRSGLMRDGIGAVRRRDDVSPLMKVMLAGWFVAMAVSPRRLASQLGEYFLFPDTRGGLNKLLGLMHRDRSQGKGGTA